MTKIPTEILELAISGGWTGGLQAKTHTSEYIIDYVEMNLERVALDREFWVALGKKLNWKVVGTGPHSTDHNDQWFYEAQEFLELILSGQDPTEWWAELIANK